MRPLLVYGSVAIDDVYQVDHVVVSGETIASRGYAVHAGGKGANQAVAAALAGARVVFGGKVGADGRWIVERMRAAGVSVDGSLCVDERGTTGRALIQVAARGGDNAIVLFSGANHDIHADEVDATLARDEWASKGDWCVLQQEVNEVPALVSKAHARGLRVLLNPAPMLREVIRKVPIELLSMLVLNETEAQSFAEAVMDEGRIDLSADAATLPSIMLQLATRITTRWPTLDGVIVTLGAQGLVARYKATPMMASFANLTLPAFPCTPIDTTGAGDTFIGYFVAAMSGANHLHDANDTASEESIPRALRIASVASSLCVERHGAMTSIPRAAEVSLRCKELGVL